MENNAEPLAPATPATTPATPAPASEPAPSTPASDSAPAITPEQVASYLGTTPEGLTAYQRFMDNNGGFDKAFSTFKSRITEPLSRQTQTQQSQSSQPPMDSVEQPPMQPQQQQQPQSQRVKGGFTAEEFAIQQYFESLANREEYAPIKDQIRNGEVLKQMAQFNIAPMVDGYFNNDQVTKFLDMYAKTVPPAEPAAPVTPTPTVDYIQVAGDTITDSNQAMQILAQSRKAEAQGAAPHPLKEKAQQFMNDTLNGLSSRGRRTHTTIDPNKK